MVKSLKVSQNGNKVVEVSEDKLRPFNIKSERDTKIRQLKNYINNELLKGHTTSNSIKMDSTEQSVQRLENGYKVANNAGQSTMDVVDYDNAIHKDLDLTTVDTMITELGQYVSSWYWHKQTKRQEIQAATTKTKLKSIDIKSGNPNEAS